MTGVLVDTNVLVYAYHTATGDPRIDKAKNALAERSLLGDGFVSIQNLAELASVCLSKVKPPVAPADIRATIEGLETFLSVLRPTADTVKAAVLSVEKHKLSFWDAMVWAIAKENAIDQVLSEDFQDGRVIEGVRFRNPLQ